MSDWFTPKQLAELANVSESAVLGWCERGVVKSLRPAGTRIRRIPRSEIVRLGFLEEDTQAKVQPLRRQA